MAFYTYLYSRNFILAACFIADFCSSSLFYSHLFSVQFRQSSRWPKQNKDLALVCHAFFPACQTFHCKGCWKLLGLFPTDSRKEQGFSWLKTSQPCCQQSARVCNRPSNQVLLGTWKGSQPSSSPAFLSVGRGYRQERASVFHLFSTE